MFAKSARNLVALRSFAAVRDHYRTTKPVRTSGHVPLTTDRRGHTTLRLREVTHPEHGVGYAVRFHQTDVVTHYQNHLHVDTSYASPSTNVVADAYLPWYLSPYTYQRRPIITLRDTGSFICPPEGLWFECEEPRYRLMPGQRTQLERRVLNKTAVALVVKMLKPFKEYVTTLAGLGPVSVETAVAMTRGVPGGLTRFQLDEFTEDNFPYLAACAYVTKYGTLGGHACGYVGVLDMRRAVTLARLRLYELTGAYEWEPVPYGTLPPDIRRTQFVATACTSEDVPF